MAPPPRRRPAAWALLALAGLLLLPGPAAAGDLAHNWFRATVWVLNRGAGTAGSGFLLGKRREGGKLHAYLVSNKHVLRPSDRGKLQVFLTAKRSDGDYFIRKVGYPLSVKGVRLWREHPKAEVDVAAVDVTPLLQKFRDTVLALPQVDLLATADQARAAGVTVGDDVFVVGYPFGIIHPDAAFPMVRRGVVASDYSRGIIFKRPKDKGGPVQIAAFYVDAFITPGSSGSPIVMKPKPPSPGEEAGPRGRYLCLGILASTQVVKFGAGEERQRALGGLGVCYKPETIVEVIDLFS